MADDLVGGYAEALLAVITAEGSHRDVEDELFRFGEAIRGNEDLQRTLSDRQLPLARRQGIVEDLLGARASVTTTALVSMVVGAGRGADLPAIIDETLVRAAAARSTGVARVRSAVELTDDQKSRLAAAIKRSTGNDVEIRVIHDPSVIGGLITEIGDDIIDGSVRRRLNQLRESFS